MLIGVIAAQTFAPGRKIRARGIKPVSEICSPGDNKKTFCNGLDDPVCDATGLVVSKYLKICLKTLN